jgi:2-methylisocitrate lyase-like PEP mutase family enzyme
MPNAWDEGSARILESLGFAAVATTSGGFAATLGRLDHAVSRDEALDHAARMVAAITLPVSADLEGGFADDPGSVAETVRRAARTGLAGCSIEDATGRPDQPLYPLALATERVAAAAESAHDASSPLVLTARAENFVAGRPDLADTVERLQSYERAGADVLFAPGLVSLDDITAVVGAVDRPVSVLVRPGMAPVAELAAVGVRRISVGGAFAYATLGTLVEAARELRQSGTYGFLERSGIGLRAARDAFGT